MRFRLIVVFLLVASGLAACGGPAPDATGEEIYLQTCSRCHGSDLGGGVGPALGPGTNAADHGEEYLETTIVNGRGAMPSFSQTLSAAQIDRVVDYLRLQQDQQ